MEIKISTSQKDQVLDITDLVEEQIAKSPVTSGVCIIFVHHTTACVTTADLDPGTDLDLFDAIRGMLPKISYRHPHDPSHTPDHILSSIIGPSVAVPFENKQLQLGTWQRIILVELDGSRERTISISCIAASYVI